MIYRRVAGMAALATNRHGNYAMPPHWTRMAGTNHQDGVLLGMPADEVKECKISLFVAYYCLI